MIDPKFVSGFQSTEAALSHLAALVTGSGDAIVSKSLEGIVQSWNPAAERMFGFTAKEMIGSSIRSVIPRDRQSEEDDFLIRLSRGEEIKNFVTVRQRKDGRPVPVVVTISPVRDESGAIVGASKIARDVSEEQDAMMRLKDSEEWFRTLADNIAQLAWMADPSGHIFWYNRRWYEFTGTALHEMAGWGWRSVHHPDHVERVVTRIQRSWDTGEPWEDLFPLKGRDGTYRWFLSRALPIRDDAGKTVRWFGTNTDVTEQREQQEQIQLLMNEVNHRAKNTLALVQAMARQAAEGPVERAFSDRFAVRLQALAAAQDVLVKSGWKGGDAETLVRTQLAHFADIFATRIVLNGPTMRLTTSAVQVLGMALHELATNASKYGALSSKEGCVEIRWGRDPASQEFFMTWTEIGGPTVVSPAKTGFGSVVLDRIARLSLAAVVQVEYDPKGLAWSLRCAEESAVLAT